MDDKARLQLQKMIKANDVEDQTGLIRELKHCHLLQNDINQLLMLMAKYRNDQTKVHEEAISACGFLFTYYTDIYNKIRKDEIDLKILNQFLNVLRRIEDEELDQHEGSFVVGTLLKELYVDSALRKAAKLNENNANMEEEVQPREKIEISWNQFKKMV
jgi:dimeric dUTPase (all-alpha-NTP-PPase superfamily)